MYVAQAAKFNNWTKMIEWDKFIRDESVPVVVADDRGLIIQINKLFERTYSWSAAELLGQPISSIIPHNLRDAHHMGFSRYKLGGISKLLNTPLDLEILTGNDQVELAQHYITSHEEDGKIFFAASIIPKTNRE